MANIDEYLNLITSAWRQKPDFTAMISTDVSVPVAVQNWMIEMINTLFDLDIADGDQLDILGQWIGISRNVVVPSTGIYFSWNDTVETGWNAGYWAPYVDPAPTDIVTLPDDFYRVLLRAKIAANHWNGTTTTLYELFDYIFPDYFILIQDHQDMSYDIAFFGPPLDSLTIALLSRGYLNVKPEGVRIRGYYIPVNDGPLFGWNMDTPYVQGWGTGSWAKRVETV